MNTKVGGKKNTNKTGEEKIKQLIGKLNEIEDGVLSYRLKEAREKFTTSYNNGEINVTDWFAKLAELELFANKDVDAKNDDKKCFELLRDLAIECTAQVFTYEAKKQFLNITSKEWREPNTQKCENKKKIADSLNKIQMFFLHGMFADDVANNKDVNKIIANQIETLVLLGDHFYKNQDYNSLMAVLSLLNDSSVYPLFDLVDLSQEIKNKWEILLDVTRTNDNFKKLRPLVDKQDAIPYPGMYFTDSTFFCDPKNWEITDILEIKEVFEKFLKGDAEEIQNKVSKKLFATFLIKKIKNLNEKIENLNEKIENFKKNGGSIGEVEGQIRAIFANFLNERTKNLNEKIEKLKGNNESENDAAKLLLLIEMKNEIEKEIKKEINKFNEYKVRFEGEGVSDWSEAINKSIGEIFDNTGFGKLVKKIEAKQKEIKERLEEKPKLTENILKQVKDVSDLNVQEKTSASTNMRKKIAEAQLGKIPSATLKKIILTSKIKKNCTELGSKIRKLFDGHVPATAVLAKALAELLEENDMSRTIAEEEARKIKNEALLGRLGLIGDVFSYNNNQLEFGKTKESLFSVSSMQKPIATIKKLIEKFFADKGEEKRKSIFAEILEKLQSIGVDPEKIPQYIVSFARREEENKALSSILGDAFYELGTAIESGDKEKEQDVCLLSYFLLQDPNIAKEINSPDLELGADKKSTPIETLLRFSDKKCPVFVPLFARLLDLIVQEYVEINPGILHDIVTAIKEAGDLENKDGNFSKVVSSMDELGIKNDFLTSEKLNDFNKVIKKANNYIKNEKLVPPVLIGTNRQEESIEEIIGKIKKDENSYTEEEAKAYIVFLRGKTLEIDERVNNMKETGLSDKQISKMGVVDKLKELKCKILEHVADIVSLKKIELPEQDLGNFSQLSPVNLSEKIKVPPFILKKNDQKKEEGEIEKKKDKTLSDIRGAAFKEVREIVKGIKGADEWDENKLNNVSKFLLNFLLRSVLPVGFKKEGDNYVFDREKSKDCINEITRHCLNIKEFLPIKNPEITQKFIYEYISNTELVNNKNKYGVLFPSFLLGNFNDLNDELDKLKKEIDKEDKEEVKKINILQKKIVDNFVSSLTVEDVKLMIIADSKGGDYHVARLTLNDFKWSAIFNNAEKIGEKVDGFFNEIKNFKILQFEREHKEINDNNFINVVKELNLLKKDGCDIVENKGVPFILTLYKYCEQLEKNKQDENVENFLEKIKYWPHKDNIVKIQELIDSKNNLEQQLKEFAEKKLKETDVKNLKGILEKYKEIKDKKWHEIKKEDVEILKKLQEQLQVESVKKFVTEQLPEFKKIVTPEDKLSKDIEVFKIGDLDEFSKEINSLVSAIDSLQASSPLVQALKQDEPDEVILTLLKDKAGSKVDSTVEKFKNLSDQINKVIEAIKNIKNIKNISGEESRAIVNAKQDLSEILGKLIIIAALREQDNDFYNVFKDDNNQPKDICNLLQKYTQDKYNYEFTFAEARVVELKSDFLFASLRDSFLKKVLQQAITTAKDITKFIGKEVKELINELDVELLNSGFDSAKAQTLLSTIESKTGTVFPQKVKEAICNKDVRDIDGSLFEFEKDVNDSFQKEVEDKLREREDYSASNVNGAMQEKVIPFLIKYDVKELSKLYDLWIEYTAYIFSLQSGGEVLSMANVDTTFKQAIATFELVQSIGSSIDLLVKEIRESVSGSEREENVLLALKHNDTFFNAIIKNEGDLESLKQAFAKKGEKSLEKFNEIFNCNSKEKIKHLLEIFKHANVDNKKAAFNFFEEIQLAFKGSLLKLQEKLNEADDLPEEKNKLTIKINILQQRISTIEQYIGSLDTLVKLSQPKMILNIQDLNDEILKKIISNYLSINKEKPEIGKMYLDVVTKLVNNKKITIGNIDVYEKIFNELVKSKYSLVPVANPVVDILTKLLPSNLDREGFLRSTVDKIFVVRANAKQEIKTGENLLEFLKGISPKFCDLIFSKTKISDVKNLLNIVETSQNQDDKKQNTIFLSALIAHKADVIKNGVVKLDDDLSKKAPENKLSADVKADNFITIFNDYSNIKEHENNINTLFASLGLSLELRDKLEAAKVVNFKQEPWDKYEKWSNKSIELKKTCGDFEAKAREYVKTILEGEDVQKLRKLLVFYAALLEKKDNLTAADEDVKQLQGLQKLFEKPAIKELVNLINNQELVEKIIGSNQEDKEGNKGLLQILEELELVPEIQKQLPGYTVISDKLKKIEKNIDSYEESKLAGELVELGNLKGKIKDSKTEVKNHKVSLPIFNNLLSKIYLLESRIFTKKIEKLKETASIALLPKSNNVSADPNSKREELFKTYENLLLAQQKIENCLNDIPQELLDKTQKKESAKKIFEDLQDKNTELKGDFSKIKIKIEEVEKEIKENINSININIDLAECVKEVMEKEKTEGENDKASPKSFKDKLVELILSKIRPEKDRLFLLLADCQKLEKSISTEGKSGEFIKESVNTLKSLESTMSSRWGEIDVREVSDKPAKIDILDDIKKAMGKRADSAVKGMELLVKHLELDTGTKALADEVIVNARSKVKDIANLEKLRSWLYECSTKLSKYTEKSPEKTYKEIMGFTDLDIWKNKRKPIVTVQKNSDGTSMVYMSDPVPVNTFTDDQIFDFLKIYSNNPPVWFERLSLPMRKFLKNYLLMFYENSDNGVNIAKIRNSFNNAMASGALPSSFRKIPALSNFVDNTYMLFDESGKEELRQHFFSSGISVNFGIKDSKEQKRTTALNIKQILNNILLSYIKQHKDKILSDGKNLTVNGVPEIIRFNLLSPLKADKLGHPWDNNYLMLAQEREIFKQYDGRPYTLQAPGGKVYTFDKINVMVPNFSLNKYKETKWDWLLLKDDKYTLECFARILNKVAATVQMSKCPLTGEDFKRTINGNNNLFKYLSKFERKIENRIKDKELLPQEINKYKFSLKELKLFLDLTANEKYKDQVNNKLIVSSLSGFASIDPDIEASFNCKSGKDRTGELKDTLAEKMYNHKKDNNDSLNRVKNSGHTKAEAEASAPGGFGLKSQKETLTKDEQKKIKETNENYFIKESVLSKLNKPIGNLDDTFFVKKHPILSAPYKFGKKFYNVIKENKKEIYGTAFGTALGAGGILLAIGAPFLVAGVGIVFAGVAAATFTAHAAKKNSEKSTIKSSSLSSQFDRGRSNSFSSPTKTERKKIIVRLSERPKSQLPPGVEPSKLDAPKTQSAVIDMGKTVIDISDIEEQQLDKTRKNSNTDMMKQLIEKSVVEYNKDAKVKVRLDWNYLKNGVGAKLFDFNGNKIESEAKHVVKKSIESKITKSLIEEFGKTNDDDSPGISISGPAAPAA